MSLIRYQPTELATWSPIDRLANLRDEMNRLFEFTSPTRETAFFSGWTPALDVYDDKNSFVVVAEVPGMKKEDIEITLRDGNTLTISGELKSQFENKEGETFRSERYFGKFQRSVTLPCAVDASLVNATYQDGILKIELPKSEETKPKHIEVKVTEGVVGQGQNK